MFLLVSAVAFGRDTHSPGYVVSRVFGPQDSRLPSAHVSDLAEDRDGYVWLATPNGLTRFDGIRFATLRHIPGDSSSLPGNSVSRITANPNGGVVAGITNFGLCGVSVDGRVYGRVSLQDERFPGIEGQANKELVAADTVVWAFSADRSFNIWRSYSSGDSKVFTDLQAETTFPPKIHDACIDSTGEVFLASDRAGVWKYDKSQQAFQFFANPFSREPEPSVHSVQVYDSIVVCGGKGKVAFIDRGNPDTTVIDVSFGVSKKKALVREIRRSSRGEWLCLVEHVGLVWVSHFGSTRVLMSFDEMLRATGTGGTMQSLLACSSGIVYVGMSSGLIELHRVATGLEHILKAGSIENMNVPTTGQLVSTRGLLVGKDSSLFVGTKEGLIIVSNGKSIKRIQSTLTGLGPSNIVNVQCEMGNALYLGTNTGLFVVRPDFSAFEAVHIPYVYRTGTWALQAIDEQTLFVGTLGEGAYLYDIVSGNTRAFPESLHKQESSRLPNDVVVCAKKLGSSLWIGTDNGVCRYGLDDNSFEIIQSRANGEGPEYPVWDIVQWNGSIVLATAGGGLVRLQKERGSWKRSTVASEGRGLPSNIVRCLEVGSDGMLYVSTDRGITAFDLDFEPVVAFLANQDMQVSEFNFKSSASRNNAVLFGGHGGVVELNVEALEIPRKEVFTVVSEFESYASDTARLFLSPQHDTIRIGHHQNSFRLSPSVLKTTRPDIAHWYVQLIGIDKFPRVSRSSDPTMYYANVNPGVYQISLNAFLQNGQKATIARNMYIEVVPAMWQTTWFRYTIGTLAILLVLSPLVVWIGASRKRQRLQERLVEMQLSALRSQMNPHFVYNVLNSIVGFIVKGKKEEAIDYISDFATLMRIVLDNSRKPLITLESELAALQQYLDLEAQRHNRSFTFSIVCRKGLDPATTFMPSMLIQPFVENSVKHGVSRRTGGHVEITLQLETEMSWRCTIVDNGIGIERSLANKKVETHTSRGLEINRERVEALRALYGEVFSISVRQGSDSGDVAFPGTIVELTFPMLERS